MPLRKETDAELDRAFALAPGRGWAELTAGVGQSWAGPLTAYVRGDIGQRLTSNLSAVGWAQADLQGVGAGLGLRAEW